MLGRGGFGVVYRGIDSNSDQPVAIKVLRDGSGTQEIRRFFREARAAASVSHKNICRVYEFAEQGNVPYIVMELIDGQTLRQFLNDGKKVSVKQAVLAVYKLTSALVEAHGKGIIHRYLKPDNIMFDEKRKELVVLDFGLARHINATGTQLTATGDVLGTPVYMSPEQVRGDVKQIGPQSDVYSLGVILFELLAGRRPFVGSLAEVFAHILFEEPDAPSAYRTGIPPELDTICLRAIAKDISQRFRSAEDFRQALVDYSKGKFNLSSELERDKNLPELDWSREPELRLPAKSMADAPSLALAMEDESSHAACPKCSEAMRPGALLCINCGYHQGLHKKLDAFLAITEDPPIEKEYWLAGQLCDDETPESFSRMAFLLVPTFIIVLAATLYTMFGTTVAVAASLLLTAFVLAIGNFVGLRTDVESLLLLTHRTLGWRQVFPPKRRKILDLRGTQKRDEVLRSLKKEWKVEVLDLENNAITDGGIEYLVRLENVVFLVLRGTQLSEEGRREVRQRLPRTRIWF